MTQEENRREKSGAACCGPNNQREFTDEKDIKVVLYLLNNETSAFYLSQGK